MDKKLIIIPTYNEIENIPKIIPQILESCPECEVLVVDDNSPDGTAKYVKDQFIDSEQVHLLERENKDGLGRAYLAGMNWAMDNDYDFLVQMDADFSHRPEDLKSMLSIAEDHDLVIGSRWVNNGAVKNWSLFRTFISKFGSFYASKILRKPIKDWTGGFNLWRVKKLKEINLKDVKSNGYSFQIEMKSKAANMGFDIHEHPITFVDRAKGQSKMSKKIILEALVKVWSFR